MNIILSALLFGVVLGALATAIGMTVDRGRAADTQKSKERGKQNGADAKGARADRARGGVQGL